MQQQAIPFWLMFPSAASADALQRFLEKQPPFRYIDMLLYSQGADSIGLADIARWQQLLTFAKDEGALVGVDETRFPHDVTSVSQFDAAPVSGHRCCLRRRRSLSGQRSPVFSVTAPVMA